MNMAFNTLVNGTVIDAVPLNKNFYSGNFIHKIDTTTDLNVTASGTTGSGTYNESTANKDFAFSVADVGKLGDYLVIKMYGLFYANADSTSVNDGACYVNLHIQNSTLSTDIYNGAYINASNSYESQNNRNTLQYGEFIYELTTADKTNGFTINIKFTVGANRNTGTTASFTNRQIVFSSINSI